MKTTVIDGEPLASFDDEIMRLIDGEEATLRQVQKEHMLVGIRNENAQLYRAVGITGLGSFMDIMEKLNKAGFADELIDVPPKAGYDAIFSKQR